MAPAFPQTESQARQEQLFCCKARSRMQSKSVFRLMCGISIALCICSRLASAQKTDTCAQIKCPSLSLRPCTKLGPGGVAMGCKDGKCFYGPVINEADGTPCGRGSVCWKGECVVDKCAKQNCPTLRMAECTTLAPGGVYHGCNPLTGQCLLGPFTKTPDGTPCGSSKGFVCWQGTCVVDKCANKPCPSLSLAECSMLAPGGVSSGCKHDTGECYFGPIVNAANGSPCSRGTCKNGQCQESS